MTPRCGPHLGKSLAGPVRGPNQRRPRGTECARLGAVFVTCSSPSAPRTAGARLLAPSPPRLHTFCNSCGTPTSPTFGSHQVAVGLLSTRARSLRPKRSKRPSRRQSSSMRGGPPRHTSADRASSKACPTSPLAVRRVASSYVMVTGPSLLLSTLSCAAEGSCPPDSANPAPLCGLCDATAYHILGQCSGLSLLEDEHSYLARSDRYRSISAQNSPMQECLWARGIIPSDLLERPSDTWYDGLVFQLGNFRDASVASSQSFSDGAGPSRADPPHLKKVGAGAASIHIAPAAGDAPFAPPQVLDWGLLFTSVPRRQTVPSSRVRRG